MEQRRFGRTGLKVSALTFGGGWVGGLLIDSPQEISNRTLSRAIEAGIDWVDTAASYGDGVSESVIGRWLATRSASERPRLSTKFRVVPEAQDFLAQARRSVEASLARLQLSQVDVLFLHNQVLNDDSATPEGPRGIHSSRILGLSGIADAMDQLRADGLCRHIGFTGLGEPSAVADVIDSGRFDAVQIYYNLINPTAGWTPGDRWNSTDFDGLLVKCAAQDMGVMVIRILAAGHLATTKRHGREISLTENADDEAEEARAAAVWRALGAGHGTPAQAAIRFGLGQPAISTIEVGMAELTHLEQAIAAEAMGPLPAECKASLEALWRSDPAFNS